MATIAIRKDAADALNGRHRDLLRVVPAVCAVHLAAMPEYVDGNGVHWLIADDARFELDDAAYLAVMFRNLPNVADAARGGLDRFNPRRAASLQLDGEADPFGQVIAANGNPATLRMFAWGLPGDWAPFNPE